MLLLRRIFISAAIYPLMIMAAYTPANSVDSKAIERGALAFKTCANCHTINEGGPHIFGPNLYGIYGRSVAAADGFPYSNSLRELGGTWDGDKLNRYIARPKLAAPGNQMPYHGLTSPHMRADLIAWLKTNPGKYTAPATALTTLIKEADLEHGQSLALTCLTCHAASKGMPHRIGPNLWNLLGRGIATAPGFDYSERLMRRDGEWSVEMLNAFFFEEKQFEQGTHLAFRQLAKPEDRAAIIKWLESLRDKQQ